MSVLETPRIIFGGEVSWDPIVTNNYPNEYNESTSLPQMDFNETVEQFRSDAISADAVINNGNWNPQGTHRSNFYNAYVSGVDLGSGIERKDPFVSSPAIFEGMLVDLEPYGAFTSQLFFDQISFGIPGGCRILAARKYRFTARYINFYRLPGSVYGFAASIASVVWQTSFEKAGLTIDAYDSPSLIALKAALDDPGVLGLTVRFNAYSTHYYGAADPSNIAQLEQQLVANLAAGGFQPNPARSSIVGVIGLWRENEPVHEPGDRVMLTQCPPPTPGAPGPTNFIASAYARLEMNNAPLEGKNILTIDMSNSIPEIDLAQTKQDFGPLSVSVIDSGGNTTELGTIDYSRYNRDAYRDSAGIVTLQLSDLQARAAADGNLQMTSTDGKTTYMTEQALRAIPKDPNLYINAGDPDSTTDVLVLNKGVPAGSGVTVAMELSTPSVAQSTTAVTNSNSIATFAVLASQGQGQVQGFVLQPDPDGSAGSINPQATTYMYIRTLADPGPFQGGTVPATWDNVYNYCLANWNAMAPCMDNWLDLKSETQVKAYASIIKKLTAASNFESYRYMPVTRDMTLLERDLLYRFLDGDQAKPVTLEASPEEEPPTPEELSRKMRRAK